MTTQAPDIDAPVYSDWPWAEAREPGAASARRDALAALALIEAAPTSLVGYHSAGAVLVLGPATEAAAAAARLPAGMRRVVVTEGDALAGGAAGADSDSDPVLIRGPLSSLRGHLGEFIAEIAAADGRQIDLGALYVSPKPRFDLVLDLGAVPAFAMSRPPLGYFRVGDDAGLLDAALAELPELVGEFEKPRFFNYDPALCAHSRSGIKGCTRCIDACSTKAIASIGELIAVDPFLCQGEGICSTVCPSGAIRYAYPPPRDLLRAMRAMLGAYAEAGGVAPRLLLHDAEHGHDLLRGHAHRLAPDVLPLQVEEITAAGLDIWTTALAYGAREVRLLLAGPSAQARPALDAQIEVAEALLVGMGHPPGRVGTILAERLDSLCVEPDAPEPQPVAASFDTHNDKRATLRLALGHLYRHAPAPAASVALPAAAPFGEVRVDTGACTLCMGCVSVCPSHALTDGADTPQLNFTEDLCLQCGLCERACPEQAISLQPRYLYDFEVRRQPRVLNEEAPLECVGCGVPFATPSVIAKMFTRLEGHPLWQDEATRRRMQMCGDCRVRDMMRHDIARFRQPGAA